MTRAVLPPVDSPYAARQMLSEHYRQFWSTPRL